VRPLIKQAKNSCSRWTYVFRANGGPPNSTDRRAEQVSGIWVVDVLHPCHQIVVKDLHIPRAARVIPYTKNWAAR
jgi:hypothetical protein